MYSWIYKKGVWIGSADAAGRYKNPIKCPKCRKFIPNEGRLWHFLQQQSDKNVSVITKIYNSEIIRIVSGGHDCGVKLTLIDDSVEHHHYKVYLES